MTADAPRSDGVARGAGAEPLHSGAIESEPADMPWGARIFRLRDPDGFRLTISSAPRA